MTDLWSVAIGAFIGFFFGVGCALAVMYSIYLGGYRAAVKDSQLNPPPEPSPAPSPSSPAKADPHRLRALPQIPP